MRGHFRKSPAIGVHQKQIIAPRHHEGEVVANPLMQPQPRGHAETGGQIHPRGAHRFRIQIRITQNGGAGTFKRMGHDVSPGNG